MLVSVTLFVHTWSNKSIGFCDPEAESHTEVPEELIWIPKSLITNHDQLSDYTRDEYRQIEIEIEDWVAVEKGLDPYCEAME